MKEHSISDLFFAFESTSDGTLDVEDVAKLNRYLASIYEQSYESKGVPPPEPLPREPIRFPEFRLHVHRTLTCLSTEPSTKEKLVHQVMDMVKNPDKFVFVKAESNRTGIFGNIALATADFPPASARPPPPASCPSACRPGGPEPHSGREQQATADLPPASAQPPPPASCPGTGRLGGPAPAPHTGREGTGAELEGPLQQQLWGVLDAVREVAASERTRQTLESAKSFGQLALERSLQAIEAAKEYGAQAFAAPQVVGKKHGMCEERGPEHCDQGADGACERLARLRRSHSPRGSSAQPPAVGDRDDEPLFRPPSPERPLAAATAALPTPARGRPHGGSRWRYESRDGLHIDIRTAPDFGAARTGHGLLPGEEFGVVQEYRGSDGVLFLHLEDNRGWVFESKPGVGTMCRRVS